MTAEALKKQVLDTLVSVAPELELDELESDEDFRDQFDFDSMDFLNFATALSQTLKIEIPEKDYPKLQSLEACLTYLTSKGL